MSKFISTVVLMTSLGSASTAIAEVYKPKTATLENGLEVVVIENHLAPIASISVYYKVGTADDPIKMMGISHFLEHLMFKGTKNVPSGEFKKRITSKGGSINAYTSYDITAYTCTIAVEHLPMVLGLEADRMANLVFNEEETKAEQKVVMEERRMRMDNNPLGSAHEVFLRALYRYHPYGIPPIGYPQHIEAYTNEAAKEHYQTWYKPNNAILVISGDVRMENILPIVKQHFGPLKKGVIPERDRVQEPDSSGIEQFLTVQNSRLSYTSIDWNYKAPNHISEGKEHYYPLIVLAQILGGNEISRLYRELVNNKKLCIETSADYATLSINPRYFTVNATLNPGKNLEDLKQATAQIITDLLKNGITEEELKAAKRDLLAGIAFACDGNDGAVKAFSGLAYGFSVDDLEAWPQRIESVTLDQVNKAAQAIFKKGSFVTAVVSPDKGEFKLG